ncbi:MAG: hypothetical protein ABI598_03190 [Chloroflexota bacterium]
MGRSGGWARVGHGHESGLMRAGPGNHPGRPAFPEQRVQAEAGIPIPTVGVQDPDHRSPARRTDPAAGDDHLGGLPYDIPAQANPRSAVELQADAGTRSGRGGNRADEPGRLKDEQGDPGSSGQGGEPAEAIGKARCRLRPRRQIKDQQVHGPADQERPGDGKALVRAGRRDHHEPLGLDAAGDRLHGIKGVGKIKPGHDRPASLGLGGEPERDGGPSARQITSKRKTCPTGQAARPKNGVEA